ncbi:MAG TPA: phosphatidylglycerol lysyltransferase domain-containing protein [Candidatus Saccharimonadales bacterium]|nr:phosphatidylglycerol lysyltransferase domain-containing protein [Candidatus Saccharimonadales bacterium]
MIWKVGSRKSLILWQLLFIFLGTSWLWAPHLNHHLSYRSSLISQYETIGQPYSWLFRLSDILASILLLFVALQMLKIKKNKWTSRLLIIIGFGLFLDPLLTTSCHTIGTSCKEYFSLSYALHAIESIITSSAVFALSVYDTWLRKKIVSILFIIFQVGYGLLFISQVANQDHFNTFSQIIYQVSLIVWLAWFYRDFMHEQNFVIQLGEKKKMQFAFATWAFINGILAIMISLAHIHLLGRIKGLYFAGDSAWLAQHGVIIGVIMIYLSRHLARGELRARQLFLIIAGIETIKYSVISPHPMLMMLYGFTFSILFVFRDDFDRGTVPLTWQMRLRDLYFLFAGLLIALFAALLELDRDSKISTTASRAFDNFFDYVGNKTPVSSINLRSALLAHTMTVFIFTSFISILWILFKPYKLTFESGHKFHQIENLLQKYSKSSEDYFKLWPRDKNYYWQKDGQGFIAYKVVNSIAFALADPISDQQKTLLEEFIVWSKARRLTTCFLLISPDNLSMYGSAGLESLHIGSSALIKVEDFLKNTINEKWWRWQRNKAEKNGYIYKVSTPPHSKSLLKQIRSVSDSWLKIDGRTERGFALGYFNENYLQKCSIHYLVNNKGEAVAFTNQLPLYTASQTVTIDLLRYSPNANNTMPYLIYQTIQYISTEDKTIEYFDLGFVPFAKAKDPILTIAKFLSVGRFSSKGLEQFKNKFNPQWQTNYIAYDGDLGNLARIALNIEQAMDK